MIDKSKTYRTRDGREVRIYATDGTMFKTIHGAICIDGKWDAAQWYDVGTYYGGRDSQWDLIEVRPLHKRTVWLNVYNEGGPTAHPLKEQADRYSGRIACIKVELDFEEGEGLNTSAEHVKKTGEN
jgi:hypothetical protein